MEAVEVPQNTEDIRLLLAWDTSADRVRSRRARTYSVVVHVVAIVVLLAMPRAVFHEPPARRVTPLIAPLTEPTQIEPNRAKITRSFNVESLKPQPRIQSPSPPPAKRLKAAEFTNPSPKPVQAAPLPEPPSIQTAAGSPLKLPEGVTPAPPAPPQIQTEEKPKLAFETPGSQPSGSGPGLGRLAAPSTSVADAMRNLAHGGGGGGLVVGDADVGDSTLGPAIVQPGSPRKQGSNIELLSDPLGVDFRPYLLQILQTVRRNWFAVMPESARLGRRAKVLIQFAIAKNGTVTKVVFATNSGVDSLDRAAVASISMSNPFPPLPDEFRGTVVKLQFTFAYNSAR
jgi:TonB family protein